MAATPVDLLKQFQGLLREGKVQEVDDAISAAVAAAPASAGGQAGGAAASAAPRPAQEIVHDLFAAIVAQLGNHPVLKALVAELEHAAEEV